MTISANRIKLGFPIFKGGPGFTGSPIGPAKGGNPGGLGLAPIGNTGSGPLGGRDFAPNWSTDLTYRFVKDSSIFL